MFNFLKSTHRIVVPENSDLSASERLQQERMTRRAALRRLGFAGGMTLLGTLTVDDLARISAQKLQQNELTKSIGESLAKEFKDAGMAIADTIDADIYYAAPSPPSAKQVFKADKACVAAGHSRGSADYWVCMAGKLTLDTFNANFEMIYCQIEDPNGNQGKCPGYPAKLPCDPTNAAQRACDSCQEAKHVKCLANGTAKPTCDNQLVENLILCN